MSSFAGRKIGRSRTGTHQLDETRVITVIIKLFCTLGPETKAKVGKALRTAASLANDRFTVKDDFPVDDAATVAARPVPEANFRVVPAKEKAHAPRSVEPDRHATNVADTERAGRSR